MKAHTPALFALLVVLFTTLAAEKLHASVNMCPRVIDKGATIKVVSRSYEDRSVRVMLISKAGGLSARHIGQGNIAITTGLNTEIVYTPNADCRYRFINSIYGAL